MSTFFVLNKKYPRMYNSKKRIESDMTTSPINDLPQAFTQPTLFHRIPETYNGILFRREVGTTNTFLSFSTKHNFKTYFSDCTIEQCLHEVVRASAFRPYADVEYMYDNEPDVGDLIDAARSAFLIAFNETFNISYPLTEIRVLNASGWEGARFKFSAHLIIPSYVCSDIKIFNKCAREANRLTTLLVGAALFDEGVYQNNKNMRAIGFAKLGSKRVLVPYFDGYPYEDYFIAPSGNETVLIARFAESVKPAAPVATDEEWDKVLQKIGKYIENCATEFKSNSLYVKRGPLSDDCLICERQHDRNNFYIQLKLNGDIVYWCPAAKSGKCIGSINEDCARRPLPQEFLCKNTRKREGIPGLMYDENYHEPAMRPYPRAHSIGVHAFKGAGKSEALRKAVETDYVGKSVLFISTRKTYTMEQRAMLQDFKVYSDTTGIIDMRQNGARWIVQVESLHRVKGAPHLLVLDESESVARQFLSKLSSAADSITNKSIFRGLLSASSVVIMMDADFGDNSRILMRWRTKHKWYLIRNTYVRKERKYIYYVHKMRAVEEMLSRLRAGKSVVVCCDSRKFSQVVYDLAKTCVPEETIKLYNKMTPDDIKKRDLADLKRAWDGARCVIYTSTITSGVSYKEVGKFDSCYGFFEGRTICAAEASQMLYRVRDFQTDEVHIYASASEHFLPETFEDCEYDRMNRIETIAQPFTVNDDGSRSWLDQFAFDLAICTDVETNRSRNCFMRELLTFTGYTALVKEGARDMQKEIEICADTAIRVDLEIVDAENLTDTDAYELSFKENKTKEDIRAVDKYKLARRYGADVSKIDEAFVVKYGPIEVQTVYRRRCAISKGLDHLNAREVEEKARSGPDAMATKKWTAVEHNRIAPIIAALGIDMFDKSPKCWLRADIEARLFGMQAHIAQIREFCKMMGYKNKINDWGRAKMQSMLGEINRIIGYYGLGIKRAGASYALRNKFILEHIHGFTGIDIEKKYVRAQVSAISDEALILDDAPTE